MVKFRKKSSIRGGGPRVLIFLCFFGNHFFFTENIQNAMKHMILSFKMKGDAISDHFLIVWFQNDYLDTVGYRTFRNTRKGVVDFS